MPVDLEALDEEVFSNTYPYFSSRHYDSNLQHGWIRHYKTYGPPTMGYICMYISLVTIFGKVITDEQLDEDKRYYDSDGKQIFPSKTIPICYACSLFVLVILSLFPIVGMNFMRNAMDGKNLARQDSALMVFTIFPYFQIIAFLINVVFAAYLDYKKRNEYNAHVQSLFALLNLVLGLGLKIIAHRMRDVMVDKPANLMLDYFQIIIQYPRLLDDIKEKPLKK